MPTIAWLFGVSIRMFYNDHAPPHVHAVTTSGEARVAIETGELLSGRLKPSQRAVVREWAQENRSALMKNWERARSNQPLELIAGSFENDD